MVKCAKCSKTVTKKCPGVQCSKCNKWIHGGCASLTTEQLAALSATDSVDWKCRGCAGAGKPKRISCILPELTPDDDESDIEGVPNDKDKKEMLSIFRQEIRNIIKMELENTLDYYSKKIDEYEIKIREYETKLKMVENQCTDLKNGQKNLKLQNEVLEQKVNKLEQAQSHNDIEICGVAELEDENVNEIAHKISQVLSQKPDDIIRAFRKKKPARKGPSPSTRGDSATPPPPAPIVVTLRHNSRDYWLTAAKTKNIIERDVGRNSDEKITIRESLSPTTAFLLWKTKSLKEKALCKFVWCKNGTILVRKHENDKKVHVVRSTSDIDRLAKELQKK
ncbi:hypothetical protein NE865_14865 [Phthorimaea operculella]|nr:hypothetical protein NE865_14865 [Phthorimaea operculella]